MDLAATHQPVLAACLARTSGPVLELGAGYHSTPLLHGLCAPTKRRLLTVESSPDWLGRFRDLATEWHQLVCQDYASATFDAAEWDVALIDHAPAARRIVDMARLRGRSRLLVVHDTEAPQYQYAETLAEFQYCLDYRLWPVWTSVVSNEDDLAWLESVRGMVRLR